MSNKLQNIKAMEQLLAGEHRTQTRTTTGYAGKPDNSKREIGDRWEETDAKTGTVYIVEQKAGFRTRSPKNSVQEAIRKYLSVPETCPHCGTEMRNDEKRLNFRFWFMRKKCFSCVLSEESRIRNQGPEVWAEYEHSIMRENAESWFQDADREVEILKQQIEETYWQNADGKSGKVDITEFIDRMETDYNALKQQIRESLETTHEKNTDQ